LYIDLIILNFDINLYFSVFYCVLYKNLLSLVFIKTMRTAIHIQYLFATEQDLRWGVTVNTVGLQRIAPRQSYPPSSHPTRYLFSTGRGRILDEYQLLYITSGRGTFKSKSCKKVGVGEGQMFLLFPGEWHTYCPDKSTGWDEYWIGFKGKSIDNLVKNEFFNRQYPIFSVGISEQIVQLYKWAITTAKEQKAGFQQMLAGYINLLLGYAYSYDRQYKFEEMSIVKDINKAKLIILEILHTQMTAPDVADILNMSYSRFRHIFKQYMGLSPARYIVEIKIQKSKELLTNTNMSSKEISFALGFENADYFCTIFKKKTDMTPLQYRTFTQGLNLP
jgi:AraC-like DNA-binding protein